MTVYDLVFDKQRHARTRLHVWCRALDVSTTSRQCYRSCTGFRFDVGWISRWLPWSTCHCPAWLHRICQLVSDEGRRQLRSATSRTCVVRRTYSNYGDRCFATAGTKLWNSHCNWSATSWH